MSLLPRKSLLAISAVVDVSIHAGARPVSAKALAGRHALPPRHLEPVLQALVRQGILKGVRGPHGGYALARERRRITADDILKAAGIIDDVAPRSNAGSAVIDHIILPAIAQAERVFATALSRVTVEDLARAVEASDKGAV